MLQFKAAVISLLAVSAASFSPRSTIIPTKGGAWQRRVRDFPPLQGFLPMEPSVESAQHQFWVFFAIGNGAFGLGLSALPRIFQRIISGQKLGGKGNPTLGGPDFGLPPQLLFYPEPLKVLDLDAVLEYPALEDLERVVAAGPSESYMAQKGYLTYGAWKEALGVAAATEEQAGGKKKKFGKGKKGGAINPLAARAVFDSLNGCQETVGPDVAAEAIARFRASGGAAGPDFRNALLGAKGTAVGAGVFFTFLIFIIVDFCTEEAIMGWFTDYS